MKKSLTDRIGDFIAGRGFYIVLFLCVAAIGISGYYLYSTLGGGTENVAADSPTQVVVTPSPSPKVTTPSVKPTLTPKPSLTPSETPAPSTTPSTVPAPSAAPTTAPSPSYKPTLAYDWPVEGEILHDFSLEVLAYDETMGDWRTHSGIDIAAEAGTPVCAVSSGTVTDVYEDDLMGVTVVIDHGDGLTSTYSNLTAEPAVAVGDDVLTGDPIGAVGDTALAESARAAHLHLEMSKNGLPVDPVQYLPK